MNVNSKKKQTFFYNSKTNINCFDSKTFSYNCRFAQTIEIDSWIRHRNSFLNHTAYASISLWTDLDLKDIDMLRKHDQVVRVVQQETFMFVSRAGWGRVVWKDKVQFFICDCLVQ